LLFFWLSLATFEHAIFPVDGCPFSQPVSYGNLRIFDIFSTSLFALFRFVSLCFPKVLIVFEHSRGALFYNNKIYISIL